MFLKIFTNERMRRAYVKLCIKLGLSILCFVITAVTAVLCIRHYRDCVENMPALQDISERGIKNEMRLATISMTVLPEHIGRIEENDYYFIYSEGSPNEFCVIKMSDSYYNEMAGKLKKNGEVTLEGALGQMTDPLEAEAVCKYIEEMGITVDTNGESLFDYIYKYPTLDCFEMGTWTRFENTSYLYLLFIFIFGVFGICTIGDNLLAVKRCNHVDIRIFPADMSHADRVNTELNAADALWFPLHKLYITKNYLVTMGKEILLFRLADIAGLSNEMIEDYSKGGLTYVFRLFAKHRSDGETYQLSEIIIHSMERKRRIRYQDEEEQIFRRVNENIQ